jgi:signal transduction histidine kinase
MPVNADPFAIATRLACSLLRAERASLILPESNSSMLYIAAASGIATEIVAATRIHLGDSIAGLVAQRREALIVNAPAAAQPEIYRTGSYISVPIFLSREQVGVLNVADPIDRLGFDQRDLEVLQDFATLISQDLIGPVSQRLLLRERIAGREEERQRISRELHDEAGNALTAAILRLGWATRHLTDDPEDARNALQQAGAMLLETASLLRAFAYDLRPSILEDLGLEAALRSLCARATDVGLPVALAITPPMRALSSEVELTVFRVVQESLTNIHKHAQATEAQVRVISAANSLTVVVEDDGVGLRHDLARSQPDTTGLGLRGMRERIMVLGGTLAIERRAEGGARVAASLPLTLRAREAATPP